MQSDTIMCISFLVYVLFTSVPNVKSIYNLLPVKIFGLILENCFKGNLIMTFHQAAQDQLGTQVHTFTSPLSCRPSR